MKHASAQVIGLRAQRTDYPYRSHMCHPGLDVEGRDALHHPEAPDAGRESALRIHSRYDICQGRKCHVLVKVERSLSRGYNILQAPRWRVLPYQVISRP